MNSQQSLRRRSYASFLNKSIPASVILDNENGIMDNEINANPMNTPSITTPNNGTLLYNQNQSENFAVKKRIAMRARQVLEENNATMNNNINSNINNTVSMNTIPGRYTATDAALNCSVNSMAINPNDTGIMRATNINQNEQTSTTSSQSHLCDMCEQNAATLFCLNCGGWLCQGCDLRVHNNRLLQKHSRVNAADYLPPVLCKYHPQQQVTHICSSCMELCCVHCILEGPHATVGQNNLSQSTSSVLTESNSGQHIIQPIYMAIPVVREQLSQVLTQLNTRVSLLEKSSAAITAAQNDLEESTQAVRESTTETFNELRERINAKEKEILAKIEAFSEQQKFDLNTKETLLKEATASAEKIAGEVSRNLEKSVGLEKAVVDNVPMSITQAAVLIKFYCERKEDIERGSDTSEARRTLEAAKKIIEDVKKPRRCFLDVDAANKQIEMIRGLNLIIAELELKEKRVDTD